MDDKFEDPQHCVQVAYSLYVTLSMVTLHPLSPLVKVKLCQL